MTTIAVAQLPLVVGEPEANRAVARDAVIRAAEAGARIVVLPELVNSGYVFDDPSEARHLAEHVSGTTVGEWTALAREYALVIVGGLCERNDAGDVRNSAVLVDGGGARAVYRKAHLWGDEGEHFVPGSQAPPVVATEFGRVGLLICYDAEFPEWVRLPALAGADLLAVPANWPAGAAPAGERSVLVVNVQAAAYANRVFLALADRCGAERGVGWTGGSVIVGPDGYPLAGPVLADRPETLVAECDLRAARDKAVGPRNDIHADRRTDLYGG